MITVRPPVLAGGTEREQLQSLRGYLFQLTEQLNFALNQVERTAPEAPEKKRKAVSEEQTPAALFTTLKPLIIKSAEIVEAYSQELSRRLEGKYVAQSEFGTYVRETEQTIRETEEMITRDFRSIQSIQTQVAALDRSLLDISAYIRTGLLYENDQGEGTYGVEIGQQVQTDGAVTFRKFARLTSDCLSFYDQNDVQVAYISDRKLHVTTGEVQTLAADRGTFRRLEMGDYTWTLAGDGHYTLT